MPICSPWEQEILAGKSSKVVLAITYLLCSVVACAQQQLPSAAPVQATPGSTPTVPAPAPEQSQTTIPAANSQAPQAETPGAAPLRVMVGKSLLIN
ncbi:MAG TPA: hypothetical protein VGV15_17940, partial [Terriglobales bacterium]|nr:hypothetical protein [Terriglobales bacterium]